MSRRHSSGRDAGRSGGPARVVSAPPRESQPSLERLQFLFGRSGLRLSAVQSQQFWDFHQLLRERNVDSDLTRLHAFDTMVLKHYVDCALVATLVDPPSPLLDLGSGAGFPGIPLKIVRPDLEIVLGEPRARRVQFLEEALRLLKLPGIEIEPHRIGPRFDRPVRGVISRAVESVATTLERVSPWMEPGAHVLFMKGPGVDDELVTARQRFGDAFRLVRDTPYSIPETTHARRLVVFERQRAAAHVRGWDDAGALASDDGDASDAGSGREVRDIVGAANPTLKLLRASLDGRGIRKHGRALVAGSRAAQEIVRDFPDRTHAWITSGVQPAPPRDAPPRLAWIRVTPAVFQELDVFGTGGPLLWIDAPPLPTWSDTEWPPGCTLLVPFQDPENVGAVVRTAAAFGVARVVLLQEAANPFHPRSLRAAGSAVLRVPLERGPSIADLAPRTAPVVSLSPGGADITQFDFPATFGLLVGLEGPGLPQAWRGEALGIAMSAGQESLNAAAATAVALHEWARRRG